MTKREYKYHQKIKYTLGTVTLKKCDRLMFFPTDICRDKDGNPILVAPEFHWHKESENTISPAAGTPVTVTITKDNHYKP